MAIPNNYIDKITDKDSGESRVISPAADKVRVDNENFEGTDLDEVLDEVAQAIGESGSGDGTVTGVKMNNGQPITPDENGVVDLGSVVTDVSNKVDKVTGYGLSKNDYTDADKTAVGTIPSKANDADVVKSISVNGTAQQKNNGNVNIVVPSGGLTESDISVETQGDGTVDINVADDTYTINLNHTHEGMAKLVITDEEPSNPAMDTIYAQVDDAEQPQEIVSLWIAGLEFVGGGAAPGTPRLVKPSQTQISNGIDIGTTTSGVATYSLNIKAKDITQSLLVEWGSGSTGYSFDTSDLPTGVSYDSGTGKLTITKEAATAINGVDIPVVYTVSDTDENAEGTLGISSSSVDGINVEVTLVVNAFEDLAGVKLTGTQWMQTDYTPTADTDISMKLKFTPNSRSYDTNEKDYVFLSCYTLANSKSMNFYIKEQTGNNTMFGFNLDGVVKTMDINSTTVAVDESTLSYSRNGTFEFKPGPNGTAITTNIGTPTAQNYPLYIGYYHFSSSNTDSIFNKYELTIYEMTIKENGTTVRHYVPKKRGSVPGLYDTVNDSFISSLGTDELEPVTNS